MKTNNRWPAPPRIIKVRISARINPELKRRIEDLAKRENREFSNMVETLLYEAEGARNG